MSTNNLSIILLPVVYSENYFSQISPYSYTVTINEQTAREKGLEDGDTICIETPYGRKEEGFLKTMKGQHPKTIGVAGQGNLWARGRPIPHGKGANFDKLLECDLQHLDPITLCIETAAAVKVYKVRR